jgi:phenylacetate-coenzyme A ligase PaaK-like adenylate-forming protein
VRIASIGGDSPLHATSRVAMSADVGLFRVLRLQATSPMRELVRVLNDFQPEVLQAYPSIAAALALEQLDGALSIAPRIVSTSSEVRTEAMTARIRSAWKIEPFNYYGMTEVMSFGCDCVQHRGLHPFEDLFILEVVDEHGRAVPPGKPGARILVTNLFNLTQPLIRYEVSDVITTSDDPCPCGRPFRLVTNIEGRSDDVLYFPSAAGSVAVHPLHFWTAMAMFKEVSEYQVVQEADGVHVSVVLRPGAPPDTSTRLGQAIRERLAGVGAETDVHVHPVSALARTSDVGKLKIVSSKLPPR